MEPKHWLLSKTVWANILMAAVAILAIIIPTATEHGIELPNYVAFALALVGNVLNIAVRFLTSQPVSLSGK